MPLYEYKCRNCGVVTEAIQKVNDRPLLKCDHCGGPLTKLISSPAIQFKGTGWYVTDYAQEVKTPKAKEAEDKPKEKKSEKKKEHEEKNKAQSTTPVI